LTKKKKAKVEEKKGPRLGKRKTDTLGYRRQENGEPLVSRKIGGGENRKREKNIK